MSVPSNLDGINLSDLGRRCQHESDLFFQRQSSDPRFCFELFRRAFLERSQDAWEYIFRQYRRLVLSWVERHPVFSNLDEDAEYFLNRAFEKMWAVITPQKFTEFADLRSLLRYLQLCVHSVLIDYSRTREQIDLLSEDDEPASLAFTEPGSISGIPETRVLRKAQTRALWERLASRLKSEQERVMLYAVFVLALKPREALGEFPGIFYNVDELYAVKENVIARLRRDEDLLRTLMGDETGPAAGKKAARIVK